MSTIHVLQLEAYDDDLNEFRVLAAGSDEAALARQKKRFEKAAKTTIAQLPRLMKNLGYKDPMAADYATIGLTTEDFPVAEALKHMSPRASIEFKIVTIPLV